MKKAAEKAAAEKAAVSRQNQPTPDPSRRSNDQPMNGIESANSDSSQTPATPALSASETHPPDRPAGNQAVASGAAPDSPVSPRQPWEYVDEVLQVLKTSFPLLILSLETMVDQIQHKFKLSSDEEIYRSICMLLQDAVQVCITYVDLAMCLSDFQNYVVRMNATDDDGLMTQHTIGAVIRMSHNMPAHVKVRSAYGF